MTTATASQRGALAGLALATSLAACGGAGGGRADAGQLADAAGSETQAQEAEAPASDGRIARDASEPLDGGSAGDSGARDGMVALNDSGIALPRHTFVYVGGYSDDDGLRVFELERARYTLQAIAQDAAVGPQPSYITPSADGRTLYVANESGSSPGITVLRVNPETGVPSRVDHEDAVDQSFVFSALSPDGKYLLASSYDGGNVAVYPVKADGTLDPRVDARDFGSGAQSHSVRVHASGKWAYVPNKGLDSVAQLKFDLSSGQLADNTPATFSAQPAASNFDGPRHIAFARDGRFAFVILELGNMLFSLGVGSDGTLAELDKKPREAENVGTSTGAHVLAHPAANFVYASNRVSNTLAAFSYDAQGKLTLIGRVPARGNTPRDFDIDPLGEVLIVANQDGGSVAVFAIEHDGKLSAKGSPVTGLRSPVAVAIVAH